MTATSFFSRGLFSRVCFRAFFARRFKALPRDRCPRQEAQRGADGRVSTDHEAVQRHAGQVPTLRGGRQQPIRSGTKRTDSAFPFTLWITIYHWSRGLMPPRARASTPVCYWKTRLLVPRILSRLNGDAVPNRWTLNGALACHHTLRVLRRLPVRRPRMCAFKPVNSRRVAFAGSYLVGALLTRGGMALREHRSLTRPLS